MLYHAQFECCGCLKCNVICPMHAITTTQDKTGFLYPEINKEKCLYCDQCMDSCIFKTRSSSNSQHIVPHNEVYAAKNKSESVRLNSRSGGIFTEISNIFIRNRGIVYGCLLTDSWEVKHSRATNRDFCDQFRRSKYVQSDISNSYASIKEDLDNGHYVLFSGTPCQVDAIQSYISSKENLYTVDVICYGVPSPQIWLDYIAYVQQKYHGSIERFEFRDKNEFGWKAHMESFVINDKKIFSKEYTRLFQRKLSLRPSCFHCPYKSLSRVSDITLGDFWGIDKVCPEFNDDKGVSLIIVNSDKGREIFEQIKDDIMYVKVPAEMCIQPSLVAPGKMPENYMTFWNDYIKKGLSFVINKYSNN